jgi:N-acetylglucosamine-6-sulfatase
MPRLLLAALLLALALAPAHARTASAADARPNVVVIMTDDQTYRDLEAMPQTRRLVGEAGTTFTNAYVSYPLCCPSRATFLTGRYAHNHGVKSTVPPHGGFEKLDAQHALPVWLRDAGYATSHVGKYLNGYGLRGRLDVPPGWTDWHATIDKSTYQMWGYQLFENGSVNTYGDFHVEEPALYQTDVLRDKALEVVRAHAGPGEPFFLSLSFVAPHGELVPPGRSTMPYVRPAPRHRGLLSWLGPPPGAYDEADVSDKPPYVRGLRGIGPRKAARIARDFQARREALLAVDEAVAAIVAALEQTGQLDSTYVVFTSDNGFFQGEHRIAKGKYLAYEPSTHVPLLVRGPGIPAGGVSGELVSNADLAPTVLDATGATADAPRDGRSLLPFARAPWRRTNRPILHEGLVGGDVDRDTATVARPGPRVYHGIRTSRFLYVEWRGGARELYDLARDPFELRSLHRSPRYARVRDELSWRLLALRHCQGRPCLAPVRPLEPARAQRRTRRGADVPRTRPRASRARTAT